MSREVDTKLCSLNLYLLTAINYSFPMCLKQKVEIKDSKIKLKLIYVWHMPSLLCFLVMLENLLIPCTMEIYRKNVLKGTVKETSIG